MIVNSASKSEHDANIPESAQLYTVNKMNQISNELAKLSHIVETNIDKKSLKQSISIIRDLVGSIGKNNDMTIDNIGCIVTQIDNNRNDLDSRWKDLREKVRKNQQSKSEHQNCSQILPILVEIKKIEQKVKLQRKQIDVSYVFIGLSYRYSCYCKI